VVVELTDDGDNLCWNPSPSQHLPQQLSVLRVVGLLQVDETGVEQHPSSPRQLLRPAHDEEHTHRGMAGSKPTLHLRQDVVGLSLGEEVELISRGTLPTCDSGSEIPLKLLQLNRPPFLYVTLIVASFHPWGSLSGSHVDEDRMEAL